MLNSTSAGPAAIYAHNGAACLIGGQPPPPETFSGKLGDLGSLGFSGHSPTFRDFTVTTTGPTFVMKAQNIPNPRIDHFEADGLLTGTTISGTYKVFFKDGTTADGVFSLEEVECLGACTGAPAM